MKTNETKQEKVLSINERLIAIQTELKVPKGNLNKFGNYKYRSAEDILEAVKPLLKKYDLQLTLTDDICLIGNKFFMKALATICVRNESLSVNGFAEMSEHKGMSSEQCTGTASSYARKYALNGLFLIDETEADADAVAEHEKPVKTEVKPLNVIGIKHTLKGASTLSELQNIWTTLSNEAKLNVEINQLKDELKKQLQ